MTKNPKKSNPIKAPIPVNKEVPASKLREEVRRIMDEGNVTQGQAADASGYKLRTVNLVLNSDTQPITTLLNILDGLGYETELVVKIKTPKG